MKTQKQKLGAWGEDKAVNFLMQNGYSILERNFRIRACELDIIAWNEIKGEKTLCFIEVKTREGEDDGSAERATGKEKQQNMFHAAKEFCLQKNIPLIGVPMQFEQVSVYKKSETDVVYKHYIIPIN